MSRRRRLARVTVAAAVVMAGVTGLGGCSDDDAGSAERPSNAEYESVWERQLDLAPARSLLESGEAADRCGELLGRFREGLPDLTPTPTESLQTAVDEWTAHVETMLFECTDDDETLDGQFEKLEVLTAEVMAGLDAGG